MSGKLTLAVAALLTTLMAGGLHAQASATKHDSTMKSSASASASKHATVAHHAKWTKADIKEAQEGLKKAGFYKGDTTGVFNADTRKALKEYQKSNKLPVTGKLNDDVLAKLKSS
jgi:peptidoglycan hydrolase-like protein with peptidoglycan-binding domain